MKQFWLIPILAFLFACGPASMPEEAESTVGITAPDGYAVSCITDFYRAAPHLCVISNTASINSGVSTYGACNTWNIASVPLSVRAIIVKIDSVIQSANVAGVHRQMTANFYPLAACGGSFVSYSSSQWEFAAVAVTTIHTTAVQWIIPALASNVYWAPSRVSCATCTLTMTLVGYYD